MRAHAADVVVVGAGPAGAALAVRLARRGRTVLLLDGHAFPRDKPCGDCVNPGAIAELDRLGVAARLRQRCRPRPLSGWRIEAPDGRAFRADFGPLRPEAASAGSICGWAVRRRDLDAALLEEAVAAGARVRLGVRVYDLVRQNGRVTGVKTREGPRTREIAAAFVVGADGLRSVVQRRTAAVRRPPRLRKLALVAHLARDGAGDGYGELRVRGGRVCGFAPFGAGANVSLVVPESEAPRVSGDPRGYLLAALADFPEVARRVRRSELEDRVLVTGPFDRPVRRPWAPGALLVGDAAGYYDPFTGQGIYRALRGAALAAVVLDRALGLPVRAQAHHLHAYGRRLAREFDPGRRVQRIIELVLRHPEILSRFVRALAAEPGAARRLLRVTGDLDRPLELFAPAFWGAVVRGWLDGNRPQRGRV